MTESRENDLFTRAERLGWRLISPTGEWMLANQLLGDDGSEVAFFYTIGEVEEFIAASEAGSVPEGWACPDENDGKPNHHSQSTERNEP